MSPAQVVNVIKQAGYPTFLLSRLPPYFILPSVYTVQLAEFAQHAGKIFYSMLKKCALRVNVLYDFLLQRFSYE